MATPRKPFGSGGLTGPFFVVALLLLPFRPKRVWLALLHRLIAEFKP